MYERTYQITAPHFVAGLVFQGGVVKVAAPIIRYMVGWPLGRTEAYCYQKRWRMRLAYPEDCADATNSQHGGSGGDTRDVGAEHPQVGSPGQPASRRDA